MDIARWLERLLMVAGLACRGWASATWVDAYRFQREQGRVLDEAAGLESHAPATTVGVSVVVMPGDDDATLSKAVGHLSDTPMPGWRQHCLGRSS